MSVSLVITTFNDGQYLAQALASASAGLAVPEQVVVVDDGSTTFDVGPVVEAHRDDFMDLVLVRQQNAGPAAARNAGIERVSGEFLCFLDVDDLLTPQGISARLALIEGKSEDHFGCHGSFRRSVDGVVPSFMAVDGLLDVEQIGRVGGHPGGAPAYLFRTEHVRAVGAFDESLWGNEDFDLMIRMTRAGLKCVSTPEPAFLRNLRPESLTRGQDPDVRFDRINRFLVKAERESYFSSAELRRRRKDALLELARGRREAGAGAGEVAQSLSEAFRCAPPTGYRQWLAWFVSAPWRLRRA